MPGLLDGIKAFFSGLTSKVKPGERSVLIAEKTDNRSLGRAGESLAVRHLKRNGYRIIETNYRAKTGEIDIIAEEGGALAFIEVKMRRQNAFGPPQAAVDFKKTKKIARTAQHYMAKTRQTGRRARFDVLAITVAGGDPSFRLFKNAFESPFR